MSPGWPGFISDIDRKQKRWKKKKHFTLNVYLNLPVCDFLFFSEQKRNEINFLFWLPLLLSKKKNLWSSSVVNDWTCFFFRLWRPIKMNFLFSKITKMIYLLLLWNSGFFVSPVTCIVQCLCVCETLTHIMMMVW